MAVPIPETGPVLRTAPAMQAERIRPAGAPFASGRGEGVTVWRIGLWAAVCNNDAAVSRRPTTWKPTAERRPMTWTEEKTGVVTRSFSFGWAVYIMQQNGA